MSGEYVLPKGSTILITGVNGYIGSHIADQLLTLGYVIRGTVRDSTKAQWITEYFHARYPSNMFTTEVVPDMSTPKAFDQLMDNVAGVVHVASDTSFNPDPNLVVTPIVAGIKSILAAAAAHPSIKRFVYTSSSTAIASPMGDVERHLSKDIWNDAAIEEAWTKPYTVEKAYTVYAASKTAAEREAWKFMDHNKPSFILNCVNPDFNAGTVLHPSQPASTAGLVKGLYAGDPNVIGLLSSNFAPRFSVNVRDTARLHVAALLFPDVQGERLLAYVEPIGYAELVEAISKLRPGWNKAELPENPSREMSTVDCSRSLELLNRMGRKGFIGFEESMAETLEGL